LEKVADSTLPPPDRSSAPELIKVRREVLGWWVEESTRLWRILWVAGSITDAPRIWASAVGWFAKVFYR
jgi:hypothetical protein